MHTFTGTTCVIHHNGDLSGDVIIETDAGTTIKVDAGDLLDFVGERMKTQMVSRVEQMRGRDYLAAQNGPG